MGLIYVNPEGPGGKPDPAAAARDIRETFGRMAMNDEETVALIAGGHTFGKTHGAAPAVENVGPEPEGAPIEEQGLGWKNKYGNGNGAHTITSGLEGAWTNNPTQWDNGFLENLFKYEWELTTSPAGAKQWTPKNPEAQGTVPDAHDPAKRHAPMMLTTDLALRVDPIYAPISKRFHENPDQLADAFAKAWFKLLHRDMGPRTRYLGPWVPGPQLWQDPVPDVDHELINEQDIAGLKRKILDAGLSIPQLVATAWCSAASFRGTDKRGGANGARIRLAPQKDWESNEPAQLGKVLRGFGEGSAGLQLRADQRQEGLTGRPDRAGRMRRRGAGGPERRSRYHRPVRAGSDGRLAGADRRWHVRRARTDRRRLPQLLPSDRIRCRRRRALLDRANILKLTAPQMTVLVGGMRALNANFGQSKHGVFTGRPETLTNDFFVNLLDMSTAWRPSSSEENVYEGRDRATGELKWTATAADLVFGAHSQLRALAEVYASDDAKEKFVRDFVKSLGQCHEP